MRVSESGTPALAGLPSVAVLRRRALLVSGMGFFTDAYDLFVIGIVSTLLKTQWHLGTAQLALLNAVMLGAAFLGAVVFGRIADVVGRTRVYWMSAALMVVAAAGSALAPSLGVLIAFRFLLGFGVGGDYPVSAVLMSEYASPGNRGRMVGLVFSAQAVGRIIGPLAALALLGGGAGPAAAWRILLGLGAIPAAAAVWLRRKLPEPPVYQAQAAEAPARTRASGQGTAGLRAFLASRRLLVLLAGTAGCWFLLDYAYYGNTISTPQIIALLSPHASQTTTIAIQLAIFTVAAVPGYVLAIARMDRFGHRRLQLAGFIMMGRLLRRDRPGARHDHVRCPVPGCLRDQLLLHRVRPQRHDLRPARRAVPPSGSARPATASRPASGNSARSSGCSSSPSSRPPSGCAPPWSSPPEHRSSARCSPSSCPSPTAAWKKYREHPTPSGRLRMRSAPLGDQPPPREHSTLKRTRVSPDGGGSARSDG